MENVRIPVLKGQVDLTILNGGNTTGIDGNTVAKLNINGYERAISGFDYPLYQDELMVVGVLSINDMGTLSDHIRVNINLFTNKLRKEHIDKDNKTTIAVSVSSGKVYQVGIEMSTHVEVGTCSYEFTEDFRERQEKEMNDEYIDDNLPWSRFD